ncbi:MFS transporter [Rhodococcus sp. B50]|uniref:MFS transporter n=1 Tax=Rhodococcus sp. B50 TaxID=2682847 RepID=UPI001BD24413|nr:MFS transporter [Rhodococcus sp. B50]MBS9376321.1 Multidrug efflux protein YfmO [Rhodococcus sp. B50]
MPSNSASDPGRPRGRASLPRAGWAVAFATVGVFMGIGVVSPILPSVSAELGGSPAQASLLFTSYMAVMGLAMVVTGWVSSRIGARATLLIGLSLIALAAVGSSTSRSLEQIIGFRAGWGLGNALFVATALAAIVATMPGQRSRAITCYEAAVGAGIATGPLLGGLLGQISWRAAFLGSAALVALSFVVLVAVLPRTPRASEPTAITAPFRALAHRGLFSIAAVSLLYHLGLFSLFSYGPFVLGFSPIRTGFIFSGWGACLVFASVVAAPRLRTSRGAVPTVAAALVLFAATLALVAVFTDNRAVVTTCIVVSGLFVGLLNVLVTEIGMHVSPVDGATAAASYSFVRFGGGACAPWLAGWLGEATNAHVPFAAAAGASALGLGALAFGRRSLPERPGPRSSGRRRRGRRKPTEGAAIAPAAASSTIQA